MSSIFEGAATIKDTIVAYFQDNETIQRVLHLSKKLLKYVLSIIAIIVMFVIAMITKYIWKAILGKSMSKIFGLKIKDGKSKKL